MRRRTPPAQSSVPWTALLSRPRFEMIPVPGILQTAAALPPGAAVTITASPRHGAEATVALAEQLVARGFAPVPHLAARQLTSESELTALLARLHRAGVRDLFIVGGDALDTGGPFPDGVTLLEAVDASKYRFDRIGVPSYPEGHPKIADDELWAALRKKQAYATYTVTQMCLDPEAVVGFLVRAGDRGIHLPAHIGVPGPAAAARLLRVSLRIGVGDSVRFLRANRSTARRFVRPRAYRADGLIEDVAAGAASAGVSLAGLHLYTFNEIAATIRWLDQLSGEATPRRTGKEGRR